MQHQLAWLLIVLGAMAALVGVVLLLGPSVSWLGRLPGDLRVEREGFRFYFPLTTCLLISALVSLILWIWRKVGQG